MKKSTIYRYEIEWPNGERERVTVPEFIPPFTVLANLHHCELLLEIGKGRTAYVDNPLNKRETGMTKVGPCVVRVLPKSLEYVREGRLSYEDSRGITS